MTRIPIMLAGLLVAGSAVAAVPPVLDAHHRSGARAEARRVVDEFFDSLNHRRYDHACLLLASAYYEANAVRGRAECSIGLRVGLMWSQEIRYRLTAISIDRDRAVVEAVADGAPGRIVLVREDGRFRLVSLHGA